MAHTEIVKQARDSLRIFNDERKCPVSMFLQYPNSPTAVNFGRAFFHFTSASQIFGGYKKDKIEDMGDCDALSPAFENIFKGYLLENSMFDPFRPPEKTSVLVDQYLKFRPQDICAEYVKILILMRGSCNPNKGGNTLLSDFESGKLRIKTSEKFASKLSSNLDAHPFKRQVLTNVYYFLGAIYVSTNQPERALDSFKKCYDLDNTHFSYIYGIAYHYITSNPTKAIKLFLKYISMAPECDKQYPNAYYMIASAFCMQGNLEEGFRYCSLAEDAEKIRLPFLSPVSVSQKHMMHTLKQMLAQRELLENQKSIE
ncbi:uncharacterized protein LOC127725554 [Mytilus californianus]|uniref:uncharacterized protein LOC127725554 n=1 Tax=Mytilus californianus TaxID=6549 RepID=UPI002246820E|nr:uncharacterized protein LOC127725554 [Mytilus californianus]